MNLFAVNQGSADATNVGLFKATDITQSDKLSLTGRFLFGRLIGQEDDPQGRRLHLLPPGAGSGQQVVVDPA